MSHQGTATLTVNGTTISWPVTIGGVPPTLKAVITPASQSVQPGAMVTLNGANSFFEFHTLKNYNWNQTSGKAVNLMGSGNAAANFVAPSTAGVLTFSLTVSDDAGFDTVSTTVTGSSVSEVQAILRPANQTVQPGATVTLDGSQSTGNISSYQWAQTSGTAVTLQGGNSTKATFVAPSSNDDFTSKGELK